MQLPGEAPQIIEFSCNLCGRRNRLEKANFHRELAACRRCGALARFRGVIHVLADLLGQDQDVPLREWPRRKDIVGLGMSDWFGYARLLRKKFSYQNTFYHRRPMLDILNLPEDYVGKFDFVISTDVFEHIMPPIQRGFDNLFRLLKPGGCLVFSVPYTRAPETIEHYPDLYEYEILDFRGSKILVNRDRCGILQVYNDLVFHGGDGKTLEMRLFCEADVVDRLTRAGFRDVRIYDQPVLPIGYYWPELAPAAPDGSRLFAYVMGARRPTVDVG